MSTLQNKIDFAVVLRVTHANPNGDPLNGNRPRADYDGYGEITDVCIKRKLRNRLLESGQSIFVQSDDQKIDDFKSLKARADAALGKKLGSSETVKLACEQWLDVRAFVSFLRSNLTKKAKKKLITRVTAVYPLVFVAPSPFSLHSVWNQLMSVAHRLPKVLVVKGMAANVVLTQWV